MKGLLSILVCTAALSGGSAGGAPGQPYFGLQQGLKAGAGTEASPNWAGYAVTARFRLYRMSAHLREHTIQVEKTLPRLDRPPREVDRLVRAVAGAYGRLEGAAVGDPPGLELVGAAVADVAALARAVVGRSP